MESNLKRGGYTGLDYLKFVMSILIVLRHCGQSYFESGSIFTQIIVNGISTIGVPVFFVISGFLLFRKQPSNKLIKQQIIRVIRLYMIWTMVYMPIELRSMQKADELNVTGIIQLLQKIVFDGTYYHLWYLPSLAFAIALVAVMRKMMRKKWILFITGILFVFGIFGDSYSGILGGVMEPLYVTYRAIFLTTRNGVFFGSLFVAIGGLLADYETQILQTNKIRSLMGGVAIGVAMLCIECWFLQLLKGDHINNMLAVTILLATALCVLCIRFSMSRKNTQTIRNMSTLIYTMHPLVMYLLTKSPIKIPASKTVIVLTVTMLLSFLGTMIINKNERLRLFV